MRFPSARGLRHLLPVGAPIAWMVSVDAPGGLMVAADLGDASARTAATTPAHAPAPAQ
jgi:hypothetical protein